LEDQLARTAIILLLITTLLIPMATQAQAEVRLSSLEVDLWPEYDRPNMLVIYKATVSPEVTLPVELFFRLPVNAEVNAVAVRELDGSALLNAVYDRRVSGDWAQLTFTASTPQIQIEYYDPGLQRDGLQRRFEYRWPGDYAVGALVIQVQQPTGASEMRISPSLGTGQQGGDGLTYYTADIGSLAGGNTFEISLEYQKLDERLSVENLEVRPSGPVSNQASSLANLRQYLPWILGALGILLVAGGGFWYWQSGKAGAPGETRRRRRQASPGAGEVQAAPEAGSAIYCHQCGKRASPSDRFCRSCGSRLRTE
jgi:hypothetical protein